MNVGEILAAARKNTYLIGVGDRYGGYIGARAVEPNKVIHGETRLTLKTMVSRPSTVGAKPLILDDDGVEFVCKAIDHTYVGRLYEAGRNPVYVFIATHKRADTPQRMPFFDYSRDILRGEYGLSEYFAGRVGHVIECSRAKEMEVRIAAFRLEFEHIYSEDMLAKVENYMRSFIDK